jgi:hypothetical protein
MGRFPSGTGGRTVDAVSCFVTVNTVTVTFEGSFSAGLLNLVATTLLFFPQTLDIDKNIPFTVISPHNHFVFTPLLPSTAVGTLEPRYVDVDDGRYVLAIF